MSKQARLRGDGHADLVVQLHAACALEALLREEDLHQPFQLAPLVRREPPHQRDVRVDDLRPFRRERRLHQRPPLVADLRAAVHLLVQPVD
ncbi:MAG TPA: hypothetical protein VFE05_16275 [Longimicrobiaceae bacterium]|nr:hypothetical protein [Longimicrobiaceae bacterium]